MDVFFAMNRIVTNKDLCIACPNGSGIGRSGHTGMNSFP